MRKYKAVIVDLRRIIKGGVNIALAAAVAAASLYFSSLNSKYEAQPSEIIGRNAPALGRADAEHTKTAESAAKKYIKILLGFIPFDGGSVIGGTIPVWAAVGEGALVTAAHNYSEGVVVKKHNTEEKKEEKTDIPEENKAPIKSINAAQRLADGAAVAIGNETSYGIDIADMLSSPPNIAIDKSAPLILITHTHATESYAETGAEAYDITASDRSEDKSKNVVAVGRRMKEVLESRGLSVIHDEILHDAPSFNGSYAHSLETVNKYLSEYPSIQIVFDIHRDSIVYDDNTKAKTVTEIDGRKAAQLMLVVGTNENGLEHPNWRSNMRSAIWFQRAISEKYPSLMRHINLRRERFNGHTTGASMIIEVGTSGNSLDEALYGIELAAGCIAEYLQNM